MPITHISKEGEDFEETLERKKNAPVSPGAHDNLRRFAILFDNENQITSEKLMMLSSSCMDTIAVRDLQPPWYTGSPLPLPISSNNSNQRYGFRGSCAIKEHSTQSTFNKLSDTESLINEWVPPLSAVPMATNHPYLCSPKLWPSNCEYVSGFKRKKSLSKCPSVYLHDTTVMEDNHRNAVCEKLERAVTASMDELKEFKESADLELSHMIQSRPTTCQKQFLQTYSPQMTIKKSHKALAKMNKAREEAAKRPTCSEIKFFGGEAIVLSSTAIQQRINENRKKDINFDSMSHKWEQISRFHQIFVGIASKKIKYSSVSDIIADINNNCRNLGMKVFDMNV